MSDLSEAWYLNETNSITHLVSEKKKKKKKNYGMSFEPATT